MPMNAPFNGKLYPLPEIKKQSLSLVQMLAQSPVKSDPSQFISLTRLETALTQFFSICEKLENEPELQRAETTDAINISELGECGLQLLEGLELWCNITSIRPCQQLPVIILSLAIWIHQHHGQLSKIENVVDALSRISNQSTDPGVLSQLHEYAEKITHSVAESIKIDTDKSKPGRPWRILNLNHGIIATRSHNIEIMTRVFEQLVMRIPEDAAIFFADGMKQMEIIDYPEHVKQVMHRFFQLTNNPTLH